MKTVAVITSKGGSGKTTLAVNLALAAHRRGRRVLIADIDPQHSAVLSLKAREGDGPGFMATSAGKLFQLQQTARGSGIDLLVVDTPGNAAGDQAEAVRYADLCLVVARPTFLDIAEAVNSANVVRRFERRGLAVLNQAPPTRKGIEPAMVLKALSALALTGLSVSPVAVRARSAYQASIMNGKSVEEWDPQSAAAAEIARLWDAVAGMLEMPAAPPAIRRVFTSAPPPAAFDRAVLR